MYAYFKGTLMDASLDSVVVEVGGIGYNLFVSTRTIDLLPAIGTDVTLYTYTCVREDALLLYGFLVKEELDIFKKCISVNGVGPKSALGILSIMDANTFRYAVYTKDAKAISKAPGIGGKTAERIIIDLKDKVSIEDTLDSSMGEVVNDMVETETKQEAIEALIALGYSRPEAVKALSKIENISTLDTSQILKQALKFLF